MGLNRFGRGRCLCDGDGAHDGRSEGLCGGRRIRGREEQVPTERRAGVGRGGRVECGDTTGERRAYELCGGGRLCNRDEPRREPNPDGLRGGGCLGFADIAVETDRCELRRPDENIAGDTFGRTDGLGYVDELVAEVGDVDPSFKGRDGLSHRDGEAVDLPRFRGRDGLNGDGVRDPAQTESLGGGGRVEDGNVQVWHVALQRRVVPERKFEVGNGRIVSLRVRDQPCH